MEHCAKLTILVIGTNFSFFFSLSGVSPQKETLLILL